MQMIQAKKHLLNTPVKCISYVTCILGETTIVLVLNRVCPFYWRCVIECKYRFGFGIATRPLIVVII